MKLAIVLGLLALATSYFAWSPPSEKQGSALDKVGEAIGRDKASPEDVAEVTVATWDEDAKKAKVFQVKRKGESWIIPSHHDYPADGGTRVGQTAGILGVARGRFVTEDPKRFEELGVIDPLAEGADAAKVHGKRITLKDQSGGTIIDVVIGTSAGSGSSFLREAGSSEVYTAQVQVDLSTRFTDWVEAGLLKEAKVTKADIRAISVRDYSIDEEQRDVAVRSEVTLGRSAQDGPWKAEQAPLGKRPANTKVDEILSEILGLRLMGIRPFNPGWLQERGFFFSSAPEFKQRKGALILSVGGGETVALLGNEGETTITTSDGLTYHCFFGEIALGDDEDTAADSAAKQAGPSDPAGHNRYLVIFASYDPEADESAKAGTPAAEGQASAIEAGHAKATAINRRFQAFFYVISNDSFAKLRPSAEALWEEEPAAVKARGTDQTVTDWLAEHAKQPGVTTAASGLQYEVLERGGEEGVPATAKDRVKVTYTGTRVDGEVFDTSGDEAREFGVTGVIAAWTEALQLMRPGDHWRLTVPPQLGYGETGAGDKIGPNEILIFDVTLVEVIR